VKRRRQQQAQRKIYNSQATTHTHKKRSKQEGSFDCLEPRMFRSLRRYRHFYPLILTAATTAASVRTNADAAKPPKVVLGLGVACVDMIATVDTFPRPDDKIRALDVDLFSGGNIGNTLTAISKLGAARTKVLTKIGNDSNGHFVMNDFKTAGIETEDVIITSSSPTLMVYIIADRNATRTCIAAPPKEEVEPTEVLEKLHHQPQLQHQQQKATTDILDGVTLVHLDSRHTAAAISLAKAANQRGIPVSIDVEKDRPPHLKDLLPLCDIIFTNQHFPQVYFGSPEGQSATTTENTDNDHDHDQEVISTLMSMKQFFSPTSRVQVVITTRGAQGALLMRKRSSSCGKQSPPTVAPLSSRKPSMLDNSLVSLLTRDHMDVQHFTLNGCSSNATSALSAVVDTTVPADRRERDSNPPLQDVEAVFDVVRYTYIHHIFVSHDDIALSVIII